MAARLFGAFWRRAQGVRLPGIAQTARFAVLSLHILGTGVTSTPAASQDGKSLRLAGDGDIDRLALTLVNNIKSNSRVALLPLNRRIGLPKDPHKRFYDSLVNALFRAGAKREITMVADPREIYRHLVDTFEEDLDKTLRTILNKARADYVVSCRWAGDDPIGFMLSCASSGVETIEWLAGDNARFGWRNEDEYLEFIVARLTRRVLGNRELEHVRDVPIRDRKFGWNTNLGEFASKLVHQEAMDVAGERTNPGSAPGYGRSHHLKGEVSYPDDSRVRLWIRLYEDERYVSGDYETLAVSSLPSNLRPLEISHMEETRRTTGPTSIRSRPDSHLSHDTLRPGEDVHITARVKDRNGTEWFQIELEDKTKGYVLASSLSEGKSSSPHPEEEEPGGGRVVGEDCPEAKPIKLADDICATSFDWAMYRETDLEAGKFEQLLVEVKSHIAKHGPLPPLLRVRDQAVTGLVGRIRVETKADARRELARISRIEASIGDWPDLLRLEARAHRLLGDYSSEEEVNERWLDVAPATHPDRKEVWSAFMLARAVVGHGERFSAMLGRPPSEFEREESAGWTDLHHAALLDLPGVVHALLEAGMAVDSRLEKESQFDDVLRRTLDGLGHGGEFNLWIAAGETPLMIAALADSRKAAEWLVDRGASLAARNTRGSTPLHFAALSDARITAEFLLDRGAAAHAKDAEDFTPLHRAATVDAHQVAELLLDRGGEAHARGAHGKMALHRAAWNNAVDVARLLVERGVDIHAREIDGDTPLHNAASINAPEMVMLLLDGGAEIDAKNGWGKTPLHRAAWRNSGETARLLVERGADIVARANDGATPLHFAARGSAPSIAELLLDRGAVIGAKDTQGRTALHRAARRNAVEIARVLVERGADVVARANDGSTALHFAARGDATGSAELLLSRGAEIGARDEHGRMPLQVAVEAEAHEVEAVLIRHMDAAAFSRAKRLDTVSGYDAYLDRYLDSYPRGRHVDEARRLRGVALRREDAAAFVRAKRRNTVAGYDQYLRSYPEGRHVAEARVLRNAAAFRVADAAAFAHAKRIDTVAGYDAYLASSPEGSHAAEVRQLREAARRNEDTATFFRAKGRDTTVAYDEYLGSYPVGLHAEEARRLRAVAEAREADAAAFAEAKSRDTVAGYDEYLGSYPQGHHVVDARRLRAIARFRADDAVAFARAKSLATVAGYDEYLDRHPGGHHVTEVRRLRAAAAVREADDAAFARAKRLDTVAAYDGYLGSYREGLHADEARGLRSEALREADNAAFVDAKRLHTVAAYDAYLGSYPEGLHVDEARLLRAAASKVRQIGQVFRDCDHCPELVVVPPDTYLMGSPVSEEGRDEDEGPRHRVVMRKAFAIGTTEVTRGEYARFVREAGLSGDDSCRTFEGERWDLRSGRDWRDPGYHQTDRHPAVCVNWDEAHRYVAWLSRETGREYRLPSESEWEYAARGGTDTSRHWGEGTRFQCWYANGADLALKERHRDREKDIASCRDRYVYTSPVKQFAKNEFGLFDLLGNVWEWTADCGNRGYGEAPGDGSGWMRGECGLRVLRGGSWYSEPSSLRSANRLLNEVGLRNGNVGFRVARTLTSAERPTHDAEAAIAAADDETFRHASTRDIVEAYDEYLALYPNGRHTERARRSRDRAFGRLPSGGTFRDCADCPEMAVVPPGSFAMGSPPDEKGRYGDEGPVREVALGESFAVGTREVTRRQYASFVRESGYAGGDTCWVYEQGKWKDRTDRSWRDPGYGQTGDHPAVCVSWTDALAYVEWVSRKTGAAYRLPSEAEWEYAARGGTIAARHWNEDPKNEKQCRHANGADQTAKRHEAGLTLVASCEDGYLTTSPVGRYEANAFGLRDVLGNAWEWTKDCWNESHRNAPGDGRAREGGDCSRRVLRGGSWSSFPQFLRSANRHRNASDRRVNDIGFRVVRRLPWGADDGAFQRARDEGTVAAYEEYLRSHPEGRQVSKVKRLLAGPKDGEKFRDCAECPELVVVPAGAFVMGSPPHEEGRDDDEGRERRVTIEKSFAVGVHEVTFAAWDACVAQGGCNGHRPQDKGWGRGDQPVIFVSWKDARAYAGWLSRRTGKGYRLLTESEWEYVARAGKRTRTRYAWGDAIGSGRANCESCGSRWDDKRTAPVGSFPPNDFGVHDMHGNVSEWVEDCWSPRYAEAPKDGTALDPESCEKRVLRGGAWNWGPTSLRSANRSRSEPGTRSPNFGFRVARTLP